MNAVYRAPAKINLTLEVLGRRSDGYHEVRTVLQTIDLCDTITVERAPDLTLEVQGLAIDGGELALQDNIVYRAAELLRQRSGCAQGARTVLHKAIPSGFGLGGGSSDAAAVLIALDRLWDLHSSLETISAIASELGSDVPFFLHGGIALATGRGEQVQSLPPARLSPLVLALPPMAVPEKTRRLYSLLTADCYSDGSATERLVQRLQSGVAVVDDDICNVFARVALQAFPHLARWQKILLDAGAQRVHLAGSGPAFFALVPDVQKGEAICQRARRQGLQALTVSPSPGRAEVD